jgi:DNA-binding transcriptional LysR family regulator
VDNLNQVAAFLKVVELGSFTAAAGELGLSPSAVSKHVGRLEAHLGVQLLLRTTRRLTLTDVGSNYFDRCSAALKELHAAADDAMCQDSQLRGSLRVHAGPGVGQRLLVPAILKFMTLYPDISISLSVGDVPANMLASDVDVLVAMTHRGEVRGTSVKSTELVEVSYLVCASPAYIARFGRPRVPEDLKHHNCLVQETQRAPRDWRFLQKDRTSICVKINGSFATNHAVALEEAVLAGKGIGRIPDYVARRHAETRRLVVLFDNLLAWGQVVTAFFPSGRQSARVKAFVDFLKNDVPTTARIEAKREGRAARN